MTAASEPGRLVEIGEPVGDAACWAAQLCVECGAMNEDPARPCWRCGTVPGSALLDPAPGEAEA